MSLSTQKSVQLYLDRHEIGKLFEDMMAKLIIEMPNEPIVYLVKLLQKICQRRSGGNTYPSAILCKPGMSLTGSSIPLKYSKDPQIVLPGSKSATLPWLEESTEKEAATATENVRSHAYEKPWLPGSKLSKSSTKQEKKEAGKTEPLSWNTNTKSSGKIIDDLFDEKVSEVKGLESIMSKSISLPKENQRSKKNKDKGPYDLPSDDKENNRPTRNVHSNLISNSGKKGSYDDELKIDSPSLSGDNRKKICSPQTYSKFKRKISKKKSAETKQKLQALLSIDQRKNDDDIGDSDYEGVHAFEDSNELQVEGARSKSSAGVKRALRMPASDNVKVSVCSRCAQVMDSNLKQSGNAFSDNEDFESVSQLDKEKTYKLDWPSVPNSEHQDFVDQDGILEMLNSPNMNVLQNKFSSDQIVEEDKSDFFEKNNPLRSKSKRFAGDFISENESEIVEDNVNMLLPKSNAWQQHLAETGNDTDIDNEGIQKGSAWKQKVAPSEVISDI